MNLFCKQFCFILLVALLAIDTIHANSDADTVIMTMTSSKFGNLKFNLRGSGPITIDWGDGTIETKRLTPGIITYSHHYSNRAHRTITIYGQNITHLTCDGCKLTSLDVSDNPVLKYLRCARNRLTNLDVSANTALTNLVCDNNRLTVLNLSANTALTTLHCSGNQLKSLDVKRNSSLINLICNENQLTSLDASNTKALMFLNCRKNKLTAEALNSLFGTLNVTKEEGKILYIRNNPGTNTCNHSIATDKHWKIDTSFM